MILMPPPQSLFQALADKGQNRWWRFLLATVLAFVVQTVVGVIAAIALVAAAFPPEKLAGSIMKPNDPVVFYAGMGVLFGGLLLGFVLGGAWLHKKTFGDYVGRWSLAAFMAGVALWLVVLIADAGLGYLVHPDAFRLSDVAPAPQIALLIAVSLAVQTFTEEFIFRGYITQGLLKAFRRPLPTAIVSGLIFGGMHIPNGWPSAASATMLGVALALIAIRTGGIGFGFGLHFINNLFGALIVVAGGDVLAGSPGLILQDSKPLIGLDLAVVAVGLAVLVAGVYRRGPVVAPGAPSLEPAPQAS